MTSVNPDKRPTADVLSAYRGVRVLVLGSSGFIGRWVARRLTEARARLIVAVRQPAGFAVLARQWKIDAEVIPWDALHEGAAASVVSAAAPDVVFNLAGYGVDRGETDPIVMARINDALVRQLAEAVAGMKPSVAWSGRHLVHAGSALEYGLIPGVATEDGPAVPHTLYGRTKLAGTLALRAVAAATGLPSVTARPFTVYGPGEHPGRLLPSLRGAAQHGTAVKLSNGTQQRDFAYVGDIADGLLRLGLSAGPPGEAVNLATGRLTSVREFAETAAEVLKLPSDRLLFGAEPLRADEMQITGVDVARLGRRTHWTPDADLKSGIRRAVGFEESLEPNLNPIVPAD